ncbi:MAG: phosphotransferase family protein [Pseudomonadales bacterium]|nr:phosphotransferase family protein [Pseudomonadales bacterium]
MNAPTDTLIDNSLSGYLERLQTCCRKHFGSQVEVQNLSKLSGGASAETRRFILSDPNKRSSSAVILRTSSIQQGAEFSTSISKDCEAQIQKLCRSKGVPVPEIYFCLEEDDQLGEGYAMSCVEGETIPPKILRKDQYATARENMTDQCAQILANIHKIKPNDTTISLEDQSPLIQLEKLEQLYRQYNQLSPIFELAFKFLYKNAPKKHEITLVHGDFRNGNLVVNEQGIKSVLDWELCHWGDPIEDLGWLCVNAWCFGSELPVGGFGSMDALLERYSYYSGQQVDLEQVKYWQLFGTLRWGIICLFQLNCFLTGLNRSLELAAIGRRVSEVEIDLINLMEAL